jgi:hypothetical protein
VDDGVEPPAAKLVLKRGKIANVSDTQIGVRIDIRSVARRKIVDHDDLVAAREERVDDVAAKETGTAGHEDTQPRVAPSFVCGRTSGGDGGQRTYASSDIDASVSTTAVGFRREAITAEAPSL